MDNITTVTIISMLLLLAGIAGSILPFLPGPPLSLAALILYGFVTKFQEMSVTAIVIFSLLTALTVILDIAAPALGAKGKKASRHGVWGSVVGGIAGLFLLGPFGVVIGPFVGAFTGELLSSASTESAIKVAWGTFVGFLVSTLSRLAVAVSMAVYLIYILLK